MKKHLLTCWIFFCSALTFSGTPGVFRMGIQSKTVLSEKDVECIFLFPEAVKFRLTPEADKKLVKITSDNIGKKMDITICDKKNSPSIMMKIKSPFTSSIDSTQFQCLIKSSLAKCKEVPR